MRRASRKTDANQAAVVAALEQIGCLIADTSGVGGGFPDLVVGWRSRMVGIEVKNLAGRGRRKTAQQEEFHRAWAQMPVRVVTSPAEAIQAVQELTA